MGPSRGFWPGPAAALVCLAALWAALPGSAEAGESGASAAALVARGIAHFGARSMREGLAELERAVELSPRWDVARRALVCALVRSGQPSRALPLLEGLIGERTARALAAGDSLSGALASPANPEDVLSLATVMRDLGRAREADRLYRAAADLWGPTSPSSARAYSLLADMLEGSAAPWGDPAAERAKVLALSGSLEIGDPLTPFVDPREVTELAPFTWPVRAAGGDSSEVAWDVPPRLASWPGVETAWAEAAPADTAASGPDGPRPPAPGGVLTAEVVVTAEGSVIEVEVVSPADPDAGLVLAAELALGRARFEPATSGGQPVEARIAIELPEVALRTAGEPALPGDGPQGP